MTSDEEETREHPPPAPLSPPARSSVEESGDKPVDEAVEELLKKAMPDAEFRKRLQSCMEKVKRSIGIYALDNPEDYDKNDLTQVALHTVRFNPGHLFSCKIEEAHEMEVVIASSIAYVKNMQNEYGVRYDSAKLDYERALNIATQHCPGKTQKERVAYAVTNIPELKGLDRHVQILKVFRDMLEGIPEAYGQIDMSLKKILARREEKFYSNEKGGNKW